ncbi:MAG: DUF418 domain-containing protein [Bacteroidales bacterium]
MKPSPSRLQVVDALRGFAIVSIMLLHNIEHFDFYYTPEGLPGWMNILDKGIWETLFFMFGGKSYAIFALLFGLTFFIQSDNQSQKGKDFRGRFAWRLILLFGFGLFNSAFYQGDILTIYAILGFSLIPVARLNNTTVFWIAMFLMLQPYEWFNVINALNAPVDKLPDPISWSYFGKMETYITANSLINTLVGNLTTGKTAVLIWNWENGRLFQTISLFMFGMLAGRNSLFSITTENKRFWSKSLLVAALIFIPLYYIKTMLGEWVESESLLRPLQTIETSWLNMAFMMVLVSVFMLLFQTRSFNKVLAIFSPIGQMSLSNYIMQSILGSIIYYGFGFGLYKYTGVTHCLLIGLTLALLQGIFSTWWMKHHKQGPLETIWHKATWVGYKRN